MLILTGDEIAILTGRRMPAAQIRWLEKHSWIHDIGADGRPKVARAYFERRMVYGDELATAEAGATAAVTNDWQVNVGALRSEPSIS